MFPTRHLIRYATTSLEIHSIGSTGGGAFRGSKLDGGKLGAGAETGDEAERVVDGESLSTGDGSKGSGIHSES